MNCNEARRHWNLYHDSEGDPELYFAINEHLAECPGCAEWFHEQSRLEEALAAKLASAEPSRELWASVLAGSGVRRPASLRRWLFLGSLLAMAAGLMVAVFLGNRIFDGETDDLAKLTAATHRDLVSGRLTAEFQSESDLEVEDYLHGRVTFPVRCPPRQDSGFLVRGAGVRTLGECDTAYLVGLVDGRTVSIFIMSRDSLPRFPHQHAALEREKTHQCAEGREQMVMAEIDRNVVLVVGEIAPERLLNVLRAYGTYPERHQGSLLPARPTTAIRFTTAAEIETAIGA